MAPKSLAEQIAELEDPTPKDFDPEDLDRAGPDSDDEAGQAADPNAGREHYQAVGKAKLRKQDPINLGKQYAGSRISRDALEAESDDDPFKARSSDEEDSEDEEEEDSELGSEDDEDLSEESEEERPKKSKKSGKADKKQQKKELEVSSEDEDMDGMETDGLEEIEGSEEGSEDELDEDDLGGEFPSDDDDDEEDDEDEEDEDDDDDDDDDDEDRHEGSSKKSKSDDREELRRLMSSDQKTIAATISQAAKADAAKGKAVKQQRATFDALLNTRIKLQKGLTAIDQLSIAAKGNEESNDIDGEAIKSAESAALALWSTLEDLRLALADAQAPGESKKRKRPSAATLTTSTDSLWKRMADVESDAVPRRRTILDKWSLKVRGSNAALPNARGKLMGTSAANQQTITAVIDAQIASEIGDRSAKRSRKNASSNGNATSADAEHEPIYDDTVFYQSLLRDLVEQRMSSSDAITNGIDTLHIQLPTRLSVHPVTGMRKDKVKREIDTRASKGRKMRFEVHERLQNFMAPEDRGRWTNTAREEFFASLLGKTASGLLREGDDEEVSAAEESDEDREEGGLKLFRS
ncbi:AATF family protein [Aspergillus clavatus NRRL 1]|uniref:Protein BFR2 n=1 Tax=Aspergillus clavatus (strain ATCC 1007 / CBS 513.65 / DSM 816 / NCTC 3887 / NRRL 1 / QM 1276 / 107) TaxID=344612 RepID=A1CTH3_ASPCL|nr:transcription factor AATF/Che-1, putative [Aspergillus clavatus NRRL 1]EAW06610.1 transcription factor AATF/Che-1, putative [Aspergillus clavatus NRRL 1]